MTRIKHIISPVFLFLCVSFMISQSASFFKDIHSESPMFYQTGGDVEWWVRIVSYKVQIVWMALFVLYVGLRDMRISWKLATQIAAYYWTAGKDIVDWFANGNRDTKYIDWIITAILLISIELLWGRMRSHNEKKVYRPTFKDYRRMQREIIAGNEMIESLSNQNMELQKQVMNKSITG